MSDHTPGPWRVEEDTTVIWGKCDPGDRTTWGMGYPIAQTRTAVNNPRNIGPEMDEALANARLIARAPEMADELARLRALNAELVEGLRWIDEQRYIDRSTINPDNAFEKAGKLNACLIAIMDRARALITKAEREGA